MNSKESSLWHFIHQMLLQQKPVVLLCVLESSGSSPGRQGFKMAVTEDELHGSIGGGIMEHKFVEMARDLIRKNNEEVMVKKQVHNKNSSYQSGMICSGEQTVAVYPVNDEPSVVLHIATAIEKNHNGTFSLSPGGFTYSESSLTEETISFHKVSESEWLYSEKTGFKNILTIIGGGHVSLAFSRLMSNMDFFIRVIDDRPALNTLEQNQFAHEKFLVSYDELNNLLPEGENSYVVIMTFGYRSDGIVVRQLLNKNFRYLGLLGSKAKIKKMLNELEEEGFDPAAIQKLHAPVGITINSRTPDEIAVSIAAEIIQEKNKAP
jgi:xanthine dehydrogenase accessory factor